MKLAPLHSSGLCPGRRPMRRGTLTIRARYVYPVEGPPIENGCLTIEQGRIAWVGIVERSHVRHQPRQRGDRAGLCRTRTRISSSRRCEPPGVRRRKRGLLAAARGRPAAGRSGRNAPVRRRDRNVKASTDAGTTLLADITTAGLSWESVAAAPLRAVVFAELIGLKRDRGLETSDMAWRWLGSIRPENQVAACARPGLSPHAPYSTAGWLYHKAVASRMPLSTHLAEMPEELRLLQHRDGPLARLPGRPGRLGRRVGADRSAPGRLRAQRRAAQRRLADRPRDLPRARRLLATASRGRARGPPRGHRLLPEDACPVRACPSPLPRATGTRRDRLPGDRQPGLQREPEHPRRDSFPAQPRRVALGRALVDHGDSLRRLGPAPRPRPAASSPASPPTWRSSPCPTATKKTRTTCFSNPNARDQHGLRGGFRERGVGRLSEAIQLTAQHAPPLFTRGREVLTVGASGSISVQGCRRRLAAATGRDTPRPSRKS